MLPDISPGETISSLVRKAKHDLFSLSPASPLAVIMGKDKLELATELSEITYLGRDEHWLYLVVDHNAKNELVKILHISPNHIETIKPTLTLESRMDQALPAVHNLVIWDYFDIGYTTLTPVFQKPWVRIYVCAIYFKWGSNFYYREEYE